MKQDKIIYLVGSLANKEIPYFANEMRNLGFEVFDQWWSPGPLADSYWRHYIKIRGLTFKQALADYAGKHIFEFDRSHIDKADMVVVLAPFGKSAHMELGYAIGKGKKGFILFKEEPKKFDVMYGFATEIFTSKNELFDRLKKEK